MARADCPECGGTGWKTVESQGEGGAVREAVLCACTREGREELLIQRARIPKRYRHCDFLSFETESHIADSRAEDWSRSLKQAKLIAESFVGKFSTESERGLLFMGPCGVGKTHLAVATLVELIRSGHEGLFYDYRELLKEIQSGYDDASPSSETELLNAVTKIEVLLLDDLGSAQPSPWALEKLGYVLDRRYQEKCVTLLTTCYRDEQQHLPMLVPGGTTLAHTQDVLMDRVGYRVRSRLYEMCQTVEIQATDYRREMLTDGAGGSASGLSVTDIDASREVSGVERARIPKRYRRCDFDSFDTDLQHEGPQAEAWNLSLRNARLVVSGFAREYPSAREHGLLLMGPCGVGKTHLAVAALVELLNRGHEVLFYDYRDLLKEIQSSYSEMTQLREMEVLEPVLTAEVLLLDDSQAIDDRPSKIALSMPMLPSRLDPAGLQPMFVTQ